MSDKSQKAHFQSWLREHHVTEVECIVADINGIAAGKILPGEKFLRSIEDDRCACRRASSSRRSPASIPRRT